MSYLAVFAFRSIFVCGVPRYDLRGAHVAFVVARRMFGQGGIKLPYSINPFGTIWPNGILGIFYVFILLRFIRLRVSCRP